MRRVDGYYTETGPGTNIEQDTYGCKHCQRVVFVKPKQRAEDIGGLCFVCMGLICPQCVGQGCRPFEKQLEAQEARGRFLREAGLTP